MFINKSKRPHQKGEKLMFAIGLAAGVLAGAFIGALVKIIAYYI
jgi:hypothetical protein